MPRAVCEYCHSDFEQRPRRRGPTPKYTYCSESCRTRLCEVAAGRCKPLARRCAICATPFLARKKGAGDTVCSPACKIILQKQREQRANARRKARQLAARKPCKACGALTATPKNVGGQRLCAPCKREAEQTKNRRKNAARRGARLGIRYTLVEVGTRDGWKCHLCGKRVNRNKSGMEPDGPTIDHLVPVSAGGKDELANVRLAHRHCNAARGTGGTAQLLMIG